MVQRKSKTAAKKVKKDDKILKKVVRVVKKAAKAVQAAEPAVKKPGGMYVLIDYPLQDEVMTHQAYSIRIGASGGSIVQLSIDGCPWTSCYHSVGYWWYDWGEFSPGEHSLVARICDEAGFVLRESEVRKCIYKT